MGSSRWHATLLVVSGILATACGDEDGGTPVQPLPDDAPTIALTAPIGGAVAQPGGTVYIAWRATDDNGVVGVDLSYTDDGQTGFTHIATGVTGHIFAWTVPNEDIFGIRVKAVARDSASQTAEDVTEDVFAVVAHSARGYVTSSVCQRCHSDKWDDLFNSGHPHKLNKVVGGVAPTYPHSQVPSPPVGKTWSDITYVIGGYGWKARFMDDKGYIMTDGVDMVSSQYNLPRGDLGAGLGAEWVPYHPNDVAPKPYTCGACHTTGWRNLSDNGGVNQDGLEGILGTWEEPGITCEACHGPGAAHVSSQSGDRITVDRTEELCGTCHFRDTNHGILASGGFIRHHEQYDELISAGHVENRCINCHDPHVGTRYGNAAAGGLIRTCESCHADKTQIDHIVPLDCQTCHMPRATKSARTVHAFEGDVRTHIFRINSDPVGKDAMFFDDEGATFSRGFVTLDFACYGCHKDPDTGEGGEFSPRSLQSLSNVAKGIHGS